MALTTAQEVINNSPAGRNFPKDKFNIDSVEKTLVNQCLGKALWEALLVDQTDLSEAIKWGCNDCTSYIEGDIVEKDGVYWTSTIDNNDSVPCDGNSLWILTPKFESDCYNELWTYLVKVIANRVYAKALPFSIVNSGTGGLTISGPDRNQERSLTPAEVVILQKPILSDANEELENMKIWMKDSNCVFPENPFTDECVEDCAKPVSYSRFWMR